MKSSAWAETQSHDLLSYWQKKLKEMWKFIKNFPKLFFVKSYENDKFCSRFTLSCALFVAGVVIALEQYVEVRGLAALAAAGSATHPPSLQAGELLLHAGLIWHQGVLEMI